MLRAIRKQWAEELSAAEAQAESLIAESSTPELADDLRKLLNKLELDSFVALQSATKYLTGLVAA